MQHAALVDDAAQGVGVLDGAQEHLPLVEQTSGRMLDLWGPHKPAPMEVGVTPVTQ